MNFDLEYAKNVVINEAKAVSSLETLIDEAAFSEALSVIYGCRGNIVVSGVGKAGIVGEKISATMASVGTPSIFLHPVEAVHGDLGRVRPDDIVLLLSFGGETDEMIRLITLLKQQAIKTIAITGNCDSRLAKHSDIVLCIGKLKEACPLGAAPTVSTTCMLALGDAVALTVMKAREFSKEDYARYHPGGSLGAMLITVGQSMEIGKGDELPVVAQYNTIAQMLEQTKHTKRRGAVMAVDNDGALTGIITDADLRRLFSADGQAAFDKKVRDVMTAGCKRVKETTLAAEAMAIFHKYRIDDLPVVDDDGKPVGMIDVQDIVSIKVVG
jgi:arabinose-5-phosphate isomerase